MVSMVPVMLTLFTQQVQIESIRVFSGGTFDQYVRFIATSDGFPKRVNIYPERLFNGMGPVRAVRFNDNTVKLDPPMPGFLKYKEKGPHNILQPSILPEPYFRTNLLQSRNRATADVIKKLQIEMTAESAPGIDASFCLGNNLTGIGYHTVIHPFFKDMWINVRFSGNWQPNILEAIASCVGATIVKEKGTPDTYTFEPNVEELRTRALNTLEFFTPSFTSKPLQLREKLHVNLIRNSSPEFLKRWIDASIKPVELLLPSDKWTDEVRKYRDAMLSDILSQNSKSPLNKWTMDDFRAMPIYIRFNENLQFSLKLQPTNDLPIWL